MKYNKEDYKNKKSFEELNNEYWKYKDIFGYEHLINNEGEDVLNKFKAKEIKVYDNGDIQFVDIVRKYFFFKESNLHLIRTGKELTKGIKAKRIIFN